MVGIARARGCGTCRKRKIACGLEKPTCTQCVKSKRTCTGYRKHPIFIFAHQPPKEDAIEPPKPSEGPSTAEASFEKPLDKCSDFNSVINTRSGDEVVPYGVTTLPPFGAGVDANPAIRRQLLEVYLDNHLSKKWIGPMQQRVWLIQVPTLPHLTTALEASMMALCLAKLGELSNEQGLIYESLKLYQRALHQLQLALYDPDLMLHDQTLTTCAALGMYEMSQCPNQSKHGYISHTLGCQKLIQLRGPEAHADGLGHAVFVHFRVQGVLYALDQGENSFLGEPIWQKIPWRTKPKTPYDRVYDFLIWAPQLRNQGDLLEFMDRQSQLQLATKMIRQCWEIEAGLQSVYESLEQSHDGAVFWPQLARNKALHGDPEDGMLFPVAFHFPNITVANTVLVYWAVQVILWNGMWQLYRLIDELQVHFAAAERVEDCSDGLKGTGDAVDTRFTFAPLEHRADFAAPCRNILQSIEYGLSEDLLDQGPKSVAAPLRIAYETLRPHPEFKQEVAWARRAQEQVQNRSLRLLRYYIPRR